MIDEVLAGVHVGKIAYTHTPVPNGMMPDTQNTLSPYPMNQPASLILTAFVLAVRRLLFRHHPIECTRVRCRVRVGHLAINARSRHLRADEIEGRA